MFDVITDLFELFVGDGIGSPLTLEKQRQARVAVSGIAAATNTIVLVLFHTPSVLIWSIMAISTTAAGWVFVFSVVDVMKELPSIAWLSIAAAVIASVAIIEAGLWIL